MKSKFHFRAYLLPSLMFFFLIFCLVAIIKMLLDAKSENKLDQFYLPVISSVILILMLLHELKVKIIRIEITKNKIEKRAFLRFNKTYDFKDFDGYQTRSKKGKIESYEYLDMMKNGKIVFSLSQTYHDNYIDLKHVVSERFKYLGLSTYGDLNEIKDILIFR